MRAWAEESANRRFADARIPEDAEGEEASAPATARHLQDLQHSEELTGAERGVRDGDKSDTESGEEKEEDDPDVSPTDLTALVHGDDGALREGGGPLDGSDSSDGGASGRTFF